jgi:hypothetical protein
MELNTSPKDALGRPLAEGDGVILTLNGPILFRVVRIEAGLDPRQPPGILQIHLLSTATFQVKAGAKHQEFLRVGTIGELGPMPFEMAPPSGTPS